MDVMIAELGATLYPVEMQGLKNGEIKKVCKFGEIKNRWETSSKQILSLYKNADWVERYINMTSKNLISEEQFFETFIRHSFVQLLYIDKGIEYTKFKLYDFPFSGTYIIMDFKLIAKDQHIYRYKLMNAANDYSGEMEISYSEKNMLDKLSFVCHAEVKNEGYYTKRIKIKLIENN